jgi:hypothetical protein
VKIITIPFIICNNVLTYLNKHNSSETASVFIGQDKFWQCLGITLKQQLLKWATMASTYIIMYKKKLSYLLTWGCKKPASLNWFIVILNNPQRTNHKIQLEEDLFLSVKDCFYLKTKLWKGPYNNYTYCLGLIIWEFSQKKLNLE